MLTEVGTAKSEDADSCTSPRGCVTSARVPTTSNPCSYLKGRSSPFYPSSLLLVRCRLSSGGSQIPDLLMQDYSFSDGYDSISELEDDRMHDRCIHAIQHLPSRGSSDAAVDVFLRSCETLAQRRARPGFT